MIPLRIVGVGQCISRPEKRFKYNERTVAPATYTHRQHNKQGALRKRCTELESKQVEELRPIGNPVYVCRCSTSSPGRFCELGRHSAGNAGATLIAPTTHVSGQRRSSGVKFISPVWVQRGGTASCVNHITQSTTTIPAGTVKDTSKKRP